jgi:hypothetical protein
MNSAVSLCIPSSRKLLSPDFKPEDGKTNHPAAAWQQANSKHQAARLGKGGFGDSFLECFC